MSAHPTQKGKHYMYKNKTKTGFYVGIVSGESLQICNDNVVTRSLSICRSGNLIFYFFAGIVGFGGDI